MSNGWIIERDGVSYIAYSEYEAEVNHLAKKVKELEEVIMEQDEARVDLLAELMLISLRYEDHDIEDEVEHLIWRHSKQDRALAAEQLKAML
jgi:hypothetical protein